MANLKPATRIAAICIGIIALAAMICFGLSRHFQIDHPVICKVYGAYPLYLDEGDETSEVFRIPYLICATGERQIKDIRFEGIPWLSGPVEEELEDSGYNTFYVRKELEISADLSDKKLLKQDKPVPLTSAIVTYGDDTKEKIELGKIILYPETLEEGPIEDGGEAYDDVETGMRRRNLSVTKAMRIKSVELAPQDEKVKISINGKNFEEIKDKLWKKSQEINFSLDLNSEPFHPL